MTFATTASCVIGKCKSNNYNQHLQTCATCPLHAIMEASTTTLCRQHGDTDVVCVSIKGTANVRNTQQRIQAKVMLQYLIDLSALHTSHIALTANM